MNYGLCPNCFNKLTESSAIQTGLSEIFKGNNSYLLCKNCQQVLLYNMNRDMIFDLDDYKEDEAVIAEINRLISEVDNHYEVSPSCSACTGDCSACQGECESSQYTRSRKQSVPEPETKEVVPPQQESIAEPEEYSINEILSAMSTSLLAINKKDVSIKKLILDAKNDLGSIDVDEWLFFELSPVGIKKVITYEIVRQ